MMIIVPEKGRAMPPDWCCVKKILRQGGRQSLVESEKGVDAVVYILSLSFLFFLRKKLFASSVNS